MKTLPGWTIAAAAMLLVAGSARAADPVPAAAAPVAGDAANDKADAKAEAKANADSDAITAADRAAEKAANEPNVKRTVIDDSHAHIEELRVRGQLQKVTVDNKGRAPNYEVLTHDGARDIADGGIVGLGGAAGKRVWNVLRF